MTPWIQMAQDLTFFVCVALPIVVVAFIAVILMQAKSILSLAGIMLAVLLFCFVDAFGELLLNWSHTLYLGAR